MYLQLVKNPHGGLAQLGERLPCKQEVTGSIPVLSTKEVTGTPAKPSEAGLMGKRRSKATVEHLMLALNAQVVDLISTTWANSSAG